MKLNPLNNCPGTAIRRVGTHPKPSPETVNWIKSRQIARAKARERATA